WPPGYFPSPLIGSSTLQSFTNIAISIPHRVLYGLYPQGYILIKVQSNKQDGNMCRPVQCKVCSKTTWAGCGNHIAEVKASVPKDQWCPGITHKQKSPTHRHSSRDFCPDYFRVLNVRQFVARGSVCYLNIFMTPIWPRAVISLAAKKIIALSS